MQATSGRLSIISLSGSWAEILVFYEVAILAILGRLVKFLGAREKPSYSL
jgi:hypothetical protein